MSPTASSGYLAGYPAELTERVLSLLAAGRIGGMLRGKYPQPHTLRSDKALYDYVQALKNDHLRNAPPVSRVAFDGKLQELRDALGTHTRISRVQGAKLKAKREIHVAAVFKDMPEDFLRMIVVHELAHLKEPDHGKAFYQLCCHLERDYHQIEFDVRVYLTYLEAGGAPLWSSSPAT